MTQSETTRSIAGVAMSILFTKAEYITGLYSTLTAPSEQQWCAIL